MGAARGFQGFSTTGACAEFSTVPTAFSTETLDLLGFLALILRIFWGKVLRCGKAGSFPQVVESFVERFFRVRKKCVSVKVPNLHFPTEKHKKPLDKTGGFTQLK